MQGNLLKEIHQFLIIILLFGLFYNDKLEIISYVFFVFLFL